MKTRIASLLPVIALLISGYAAYGPSRPHHENADILNELNIPYSMTEWRSKEMTQNVNLKDDRYDFVSEIFARIYGKQNGEHLLLLVLNATNFHHPTTCYQVSGFDIEDLGRFPINDSLMAHKLRTTKKGQDFLVLYWINIDGKQVNWTEQKLKQLWFSLSNKDRVGLMVRLDVPIENNDLAKAENLALAFINDLDTALEESAKHYLLSSR